MADRFSLAEIRVYNDQDLFGHVYYPGDSATWSAPGQIGKLGAFLSGWVQDPTGQYLQQAPVCLWQDCGPDAWTPAQGDYGAGKDEATGKMFLRSRLPAGAFDTKFKTARVKDEAFSCELFRADAANASLYLHFSAGRPGGTEGLRLALETGSPIRLQASQDDANWHDVAVAEGLPAADVYLKSVGQRLTVDVQSQCDDQWDSLRPPVYAFSGSPPGQVVVSLNGSDAMLTYGTGALQAGSLRVTGTNGRWDISRVAKVRFAASATATLAPQVRPLPVQGDGRVEFQGWRPYGTGGGGLTDRSGLTGQAGFSGAGSSAGSSAVAGYNAGSRTSNVATGGNVVGVSFAVAGAAVDATGYCLRTVLLGSVTVDYPALETAPLDSPPYVAYTLSSGLSEADWTDTWDEGTRTARGRGLCTLVDSQGAFAPNTQGGANHPGVVPAARAFQLYMGDASDAALTLVASGYAGLTSSPGQPGFVWRKRGGRTYTTIALSDRLVMADTRACGYVAPKDGTNHYWAMGRYAKKIGICDAHLPAEIVNAQKFSDTDFQLPYGTVLDPVLQPQPGDMVMSAMEEIRKRGGAIDPGSGTVQPMVLGVYADASFAYFALPVGVIDATQNQVGVIPAGLVPVQEFSAQPQTDVNGNPLLNELLEEVTTEASLSQIRSSAVFEGIDLASGGIAIGYAVNPQLVTDPTVPGYIGAVPNAFYEISKLVTSPQVAQRLAQQSDAQLTFPSVRTFAQGFLQPKFGALTVFTMQDFDTQGSAGPVAYYATLARHRVAIVAQGDKVYNVGLTQVGGRLLGQAG